MEMEIWIEGGEEENHHLLFDMYVKKCVCVYACVCVCVCVCLRVCFHILAVMT